MLLKTPETVPFRLTRDIVDGMGVTGIDGAFIRSAEKTLGVLRDSKESLLTLLEVFFHDPLFKWTVSPTKAKKVQQSEETSDAAGGLGMLACGGGGLGGGSTRDGLAEGQVARVMERLKQKLAGVE